MSLPSRAEFIEGFFSVGNVSLDYLHKAPGLGPVAKCADAWLQQLEVEEAGPVVLPRLVEGEGAIEWIALAAHAQQFDRLLEGLRAFVGPTYSDFSGEKAELDRGDYWEEWLRRISGGLVFSFRASPVGHDGDLAAVLTTMRSVFASAPRRQRFSRRPVGRIMRDLEFAFDRQDQDSAYRYLRELRQGAYLSWPNQTFLEIRFRGLREDWQSILELEGLDEVLLGPRPKMVTELLLDAVFEGSFQPHAKSTDASAMKVEFADGVFPRYAPLFRDPFLPDSERAAIVMMLRAVTADPPLAGLEAALLSHSGFDEATRKLLRAISGLGEEVPAPESPSTGPADCPEEARVAADLGDYPRAAEIATRCPPDVTTTAVLARCAWALRDPVVADAAWNAFRECHEHDRTQLLSGLEFSRYWEDVERLRRGPVDWLRSLRTTSWDESPDVQLHKAIEEAREGQRAWPTRRDNLEELNKELTATRSLEGDRALFECLPYLTGFVQRYERSAVLLPVYKQLIDLLLIKGDTSSEDLEVLLIVLVDALDCGANASDHDEIVNAYIDVWREVASPRRLPWGIEVGEALLVYPPAQSDARNALITQLVVSVQDWLKRSIAVPQAIVDLVRPLGEQVGLPLPAVAAASDEEEDPFRQLDGRSIGIYTMTPSAGRQAKDFLESHANGIRVRLNSESDCSPELQALAAQSDVVVMAVRSAQHSATDCIRKARPPSGPLLRPLGKGYSSIIRALLEWLDAA